MIHFQNVGKYYGNFKVLNDCTADVVCGPSGSGKSTLIKCVNALEPIQEGKIIVNGTDVTSPSTNLSQLRAHVGMVFQHFELFPHMSIEKNLIIAQTKVLKRHPDEAYQKAMNLLDRVGLSAHAHKHPRRTTTTCSYCSRFSNGSCCHAI